MRLLREQVNALRKKKESECESRVMFLWQGRWTWTHLHVAGGKDACPPVMFPFVPVGIYLPMDVHHITFLQRQLPEDREAIGNEMRLFGGRPEKRGKKKLISFHTTSWYNSFPAQSTQNILGHATQQ